MMQRDPAIHTLYPCSLCTTYASIRTPSATSVLNAYCLRTHLRTVDFAGFRIRTVYVLSPYYVRTLYADSADICTLIWSADRVRTPWTEYGGWRRQYGASTEWLHPQHPHHTWNLISLSKFGCGLGRIRAEVHRHSTDTVWILRWSRRIVHPLRSAASVRRCERGFSQWSCSAVMKSLFDVFMWENHVCILLLLSSCSFISVSMMVLSIFCRYCSGISYRSWHPWYSEN